ncbi:DUF4352 domain-containing protein [Mycolicibacterium sp.]|uniref:DUF4352 domain-containing protein n=1 Tax=Mycolicibacterium sp. TaxID=2320850 RepID=UPI001A2ED061|nr:DUF4352 domain-containing protein [Mycolicibacterium sp.]MBJ7338721.1 DUF4352 domain-containing protein [Mycolicibacterium sp.]
MKKRAKWPWVLVGVGVLAFGGCGTFLIAERSAISSIVSGDRTSVFGQTDIGVPVDDGSLRFVVHSVNNAGLQSNPQPTGVYVIADVTVSNTGTEPRTVIARNQKLISASGLAYEATGMDVRAAKEDTTTAVVNPGQAIEVRMRFDVPKEPRVAAIELHESATSAGARARLY